MRPRWFGIVLPLICTIVGSAQQAQQRARPPEEARLRLTSSAFADGTPLPIRLWAQF